MRINTSNWKLSINVPGAWTETRFGPRKTLHRVLFRPEGSRRKLVAWSRSLPAGRPIGIEERKALAREAASAARDAVLSSPAPSDGGIGPDPLLGEIWPVVAALKDMTRQSRRSEAPRVRRVLDHWGHLRARSVSYLDLKGIQAKLGDEEDFDPDLPQPSFRSCDRADCRVCGGGEETFGLSASSVHKHVQHVIGAAINRSVRDLEILARNPVRVPRSREVASSRPDTYSDDELAALGQSAATLGGLHRLAWRVLETTGLRCSELRRVRPDDFRGGLLHVACAPGEETKTGESREVPVPDDVLELARQLGRWSPDGFWVGMGADRFRDWIRPVWAGAGLLDGRRGLHLHRVRHSWATRLRRAGVSTDELRRMGGWVSERMVRRYTHLAAGEFRPETLNAVAGL